MPKNFNPLSNKFFLFLVFLGLGLAVFGNGLNGDFVHDDVLVLSHGLFNEPAKLFGFFGQPYFEDFLQAGLYRPLTQISFAVNFLFGSTPFGFHLVNVLLHIFNSFLVYLVLKKLIGNGRLSLIAGLLFLVLPIHVEAVTSIVGRAELLSFLFGASALLLWLDFKYFLSAIALFLALLSKESAVAVPAIVFLFSWRYRLAPHLRASEGRPWHWLVYYLGAFGLYFGMRVAVLGQYAFKSKVEFVFNPLAYVSFFERFFTALKVMILYLAKILVPYNLSADYSFDQIPTVTNLFSSPMALAGLVFLGLMVWLIYRVLLRKRSTVLEWFLIFFFLPFLVISNLIFPTGTIMAERLMYFPSLGVVAVLAAAIDSGIKQPSKMSKRFGLFVLLFLVVIYGFLTFGRNRVWASREALLTDSFRKSPNSIVSKTNYGILILGRDKELAKRLSLEVYEKYPDYIQNLNLRAAVEVQENNLRAAQGFLERALELRPNHQATLQNISRVYFTLGKYPEAEEALKVLVFEYGGTGNVIFYALVQAMEGHPDESRQTLESFFGPDINDESALKILRGEFSEVKDLFIFHKQ